MAQYPDIITTTAGLNIISRANANNKAVIFTRVVAGNGDLSTGTNIESMAAVISAKMELPITNKEDHTNGQFTIYASLSNSDLTTGFMAKEIGVYAKVDGDTSDKLFAYTNGGAYSEYIPPKDIPIKTQILQIDVAVGNAETLNVTISDDTYATQLDLEMHNSATDAHSALTATIDDTNVPTSDTNTIRNLVSNLANRIKAATGAGGWKEAPAATLASLSKMFANLATGADVTWDGKKVYKSSSWNHGSDGSEWIYLFWPELWEPNYTVGKNWTSNGTHNVPHLFFIRFKCRFTCDSISFRWENAPNRRLERSGYLYEYCACFLDRV